MRDEECTQSMVVVIEGNKQTWKWEDQMLLSSALAGLLMCPLDDVKRVNKLR